MEKYSQFLLTFIILLTTSGSAAPYHAPDQSLIPSPYTPYKSIRTEQDGLTLTVDYFTYQIEGETVQELRDQMDLLGKTDKSGETWDAYTEWFIHWNYQETRSDIECATGPVELNINIRIFLPGWEIPSDTSPELTEKWEAYLLALLQHEDEHRKIIFMRAEALYNDLNQIPAHATCQELTIAIDTVGKIHKDDLYQISTTYDLLTDHGQTLGASFP